MTCKPHDLAGFRTPCKLILATVILVILAAPMSIDGQGAIPTIDRKRGKEMLQNVKSALKELYYDPAFRGMKVDERFKKAESDISASTSTYQINTIIAQVLLELDDSHTFFLPTELVLRVKFGFQMQMIGNLCYITYVAPKSNAEAKGLKVGDMLYAIDGYEPTRESLWRIVYSYFTLMPPPSLRLTIQDPDGKLRDIAVEASVIKKTRRKVIISDKTENPPQYFDLSADVIACRLRAFDLSDKEVDEMMRQIQPRKTLILDLRGNPGGSVRMEQRLLGYFFDKDIKIGDEKTRKKTTERLAKTRGQGKTFQGKVIVLIDSRSGSAAEVFAKIMQLEKRGTVLGDRSAGAVMTAVQATFPFVTASDWQAIPSAFYGASITVGDLIMTDGKSLERAGVTPDQVVLPTGGDLFKKRDPVLSRAAAIAGVQIDEEKAGSIFPFEPDDDEDDDNKGKEKK